MILAAGRGERLRPLTDERPKPLIEVGGKPLIEWHIERLAAAGFERLVVNLGWLGEQIPARVGDGRRWDVRIEYSDEQSFDAPLETGGGIHHALTLLGEDAFLVVNGDTFSDIDVGALRDQPLADEDVARLVLVPNPAWHPDGDFALDGERVRDEGVPRRTFSGTAVYRPELFSGCKPGRFSVVPLLRRAMADRRVAGVVHDGDWTDAGTPQRLESLRQKMARHTDAG